MYNNRSFQFTPERSHALYEPLKVNLTTRDTCTYRGHRRHTHTVKRTVSNVGKLFNSIVSILKHQQTSKLNSREHLSNKDHLFVSQ